MGAGQQPAPTLPQKGHTMRHVTNALLALIVFTLGALVAALYLYPAVSGHDTITINGPSMGNTLPYGSLAYITPQDAYATGDVVTFSDGYNLITHRLIHDADGHGTLWQTQGDANETPDPLLIRNKVIAGRVVAYLPYIGIALQVVRQPAVLGFVVLLALLLVVLSGPPAPPRGAKLPHASSPETR